MPWKTERKEEHRTIRNREESQRMWTFKIGEKEAQLNK